MTNALNISLDPRFQAYEPYFDHDWSVRFLACVDAKGLSHSGLSLCMQLKSAIVLGALPFKLVEMCSAACNALNTQNRPFPVRVLDEMIQSVWQQSGIAESESARIQQALRSLHERAQLASMSAKVEIQPQVLWDDLFNIPEFRMSIYAAQRMAFCQQFFAYENYLLHLVQNLSNSDDVRTGRQFPEHLRKVFGDQMANHLWCSGKLKTARLARNALAHAGGKETKELQSINHGFEVVDGYVQINVADCRFLFQEISAAADKAIANVNGAFDAKN
ncbi:MAG: hypothetical protein AAGF84_04745 [Planctomycetota bacterium]